MVSSPPAIAPQSTYGDRYRTWLLEVEGVVDSHATTIGTHTTQIADHETRIDDLEAAPGGGGGGTLTGWYDVTDAAYGATGDGTTDDTAEIQAAITACGAAGGGIVYLPPGTYRLNTALQSAAGGRPACLVVAYDNVWIMGAGPASVLKNTTAAVSGVPVEMFFIAGASKGARLAVGDVAQWLNYTITGVSGAAPTIRNLTGTTAKGATAVTLASSGHLSSFVVGDWIFIRTGQTLGGGFNHQPIAEINRVAALSGSTITLVYPTAHRYAQHYYLSGTTGLTSESVTANLAPYGVSNITALALQNPRLSDFAVDSQTGAAIVGGGWAVNPIWERITGTVSGSGFESFSCHKSHVMRDCRIHSYDMVYSGYAFTVDTGCTEGKCLDNELTSEDHVLHVHVHEAAAATLIRGNILRGPGVNLDENHVSIRAGAGETIVTENQIYGGGFVQIYVDDTCKDGGYIGGNIHAPGPFTTAAAVVMDGSTGWTVAPAPVQGTAGTFVTDRINNHFVGAQFSIPINEFTLSAATFATTSGVPVISFPSAGLSQAFARFTAPPDWRGAQILVRWTNLGAGTGTCGFGLITRQTVDGEDITATDLSTGADGGAAPLLNISKTTEITTSDITLGPGQSVLINIYRNPGGGEVANAVGIFEVLVRRT